MRHWIDLVESAEAAPTLKATEVYHIGTLDPSHKRSESYEGEGLSVSVNPSAWASIARLGGNPLWRLTKSNGRFLDYHDLSPEQLHEMVQWGIEHGWVEPKTVFRAYWYDEEDDAERYMTFDDADEAHEQIEDLEDARVEPVSQHPVSTPKLQQRCRQNHVIHEPHQLLATIWADDVLGLDGVWFADDLDPYALSAPRGVIFVSRLPEWHVEATEDWPDEDY